MAVAKKVSLLGSFAVGKTSLVARFVKSMFSEDYHTTIGVKVDKKIVEVAGAELKLMIWDIAGKDDFFEPPESYLKGSAGFLMVIDGTRGATLQVARNMRQRMSDTVGEIPFVALINKVDLRDDWEITDEEIEGLRGEGFPVLLTSAKTGENVEEAFLHLSQAMMG